MSSRLKEVWEQLEGKVTYLSFEEFESKFGEELLEQAISPNPYFSVRDNLIRVNDIPKRFRNFESGKRDDELAQWLLDYLRKGKESAYASIVERIKSELNVTDQRIYVILGKKGLWNPTELPFFYKQSEPESFSLDEDPYKDVRKDLTKHYTFAVDDAETIEVDDAITILDNKLMIHIADVSAVVHRGSILDEHAKKLATSIYIPEGNMYMFPTKAIESMSLHGGVKPAITLIMEFDDELNLREFKFIRSYVQVKDRFTYDHFEKLLSIDPFKKLLRLARKLQVLRMERGGTYYVLPMKRIKLKEDGSIDYSLVDLTSKAYTVITELMILFNYLSAKLLASRSIPAIYRTQIQETKIELDERDPLYYYKLMTQFSPTFLSHEPSPHELLGLEVYAQFTSPIRRYYDIVNQRQLHAVLDGKNPPYDSDSIYELIHELIHTEKARKNIQKERLDFWTYEYIRRNYLNTEKLIRGVVAEAKERYSIIFFPYFLISERIYYRGLIVGSRVNCQVRKVDPYNKKMEIYVVKQPKV